MFYDCLLNILMTLLSAQIARAYLASFSKLSSGSPAWRRMIWIVYICFEYFVMITDAEYPLFILIMNVLFVALLYLYTCGGHFRTALFHSGVFCAAWMAIEVATQGLLLLVGTGSENFFVIGNVLSKIAMYIAVQIYSRYKKRENGIPVPLRYWIRLFLVPAVSVYIIYDTYIRTLQDGSRIAFIIVSILMILVNLVIFDVYEKIGMQAFIERQNQTYKQEIQLCTRQATERETAYRQTRMLRHDLNDRLVGIGALLEAGFAKDAAKEIEKMLYENRLYRNEVSHSGNLALDALINYKYSVAIGEGIEMECYVEVPANLPVNDTDLCIILGNLLDNAMEAVLLLPQGKRKIKLTIRMEKNVLSIMVENPYKGKIIKDATGQIKSSKTVDEEHGIGLLSVRKTVEKYNGELIIRHDEEIFRALLIMYPQENLHPEQ